MNYYPGAYVHCKQVDKILEFSHHNNFQGRGKSVEKMVRDCVDTYNLLNDFEFIVDTGDIPGGNLNDIPIFHYCNNNNLDKLFPDFIYDSWPEINVSDTSTEVNNLRQIDSIPLTNKIGWIGTLLCNKRVEVHKRFSNDERFEIIPIQWIYTPEPPFYADNYLSYTDQIKRWKFLLDIEGAGYSGRVKIFLASQRVPILIDRMWKDWCWYFLEPWKHYVPVKEDLSDFNENYNRVVNDEILQQSIIEENKKLYDTCLSYKSAILQIKNLICSI